MDCKLVVVGKSDAVGKSSLLITYNTGSFPGEYIPSVGYDHWIERKTVDAIEVNFAMWDTRGQEDYDRLRPLAYPHTDVFLLCFSVDEPMSLKNVKERWYPELNHHCPETPILLVGTKEDLRDDNRREPLKASPLVSAEEGLKTAKDIGARGYAECSALSGRGVAEVLTKVAPLAKRTPPTATTTHNRGEGRKCTIL